MKLFSYVLAVLKCYKVHIIKYHSMKLKSMNGSHLGLKRTLATYLAVKRR